METSTGVTIELGHPYIDTITGFKGTCVSICHYMSGCTHIDLVRGDEKGKPEQEWFDSERLIADPEGKVMSRVGPDRSPGNPPPRH